MAASGSGTFVKRSWRRFRRRPMRTQAVSWVLLLVIVGGVVFGITASSSSSKITVGHERRIAGPLTASRDREHQLERGDRHLDPGGVPGLQPDEPVEHFRLRR